jgi:hypothetical protein
MVSDGELVMQYLKLSYNGCVRVHLTSAKATKACMIGSLYEHIACMISSFTLNNYMKN